MHVGVQLLLAPLYLQPNHTPDMCTTPVRGIFERLKDFDFPRFFLTRRFVVP